jgi:hypothetical protein
LQRISKQKHEQPINSSKTTTATTTNPKRNSKVIREEILDMLVSRATHITS